jgi:bifunctional DNase/RNase
MEVEMKIRGLMMDPQTNNPIVVLKDVNGTAILPIWVGIYEASAIASEIEKHATPRPMTHDLIRNVLFGLEASVKKIVVSDLKDDTFYAVIWLERDGEMISIDSRPSDALAWRSHSVWIARSSWTTRCSKPRARTLPSPM